MHELLCQKFAQSQTVQKMPLQRLETDGKREQKRMTITIESIRFGEVVINKKRYGDVLIIGDKISERDWKSGSHRVSETEAEKLISSNPEAVIIATGQSGCLEVDSEIEDKIKRCTELIVLRTPDAVEKFDDLAKNKKVNALIHTTC